MSDILVVGAAPSRSRLIEQGLEGMPGRVTRKRWRPFLQARPGSPPALVIYDLAGANTPEMDVLASLPSRMPQSGVLFFVNATAVVLEGLSRALQQPNVDFILDTSDPRELRMRATRLLGRGAALRSTPPDKERAAAPVLHNALQHTVANLHADNGRLDAHAIRRLYGISLAALARALGRSEQAVHKTPAGAGLQPDLRVYERIAALLLRLTGSEAGLRAWMQASNPELENATPMELLLNGEGAIVADLLESVLRGEPV